MHNVCLCVYHFLYYFLWLCLFPLFLASLLLPRTGALRLLYHSHDSNFCQSVFSLSLLKESLILIRTQFLVSAVERYIGDEDGIPCCSFGIAQGIQP